MTGKTININLFLTDSILNLKNIIMDKEGIPLEQ